jgi:hypothetical protein
MRRTLGKVVPILAVVAVLLTAPYAATAWNGTQEIKLGDQVTGEFAGGAVPEMHTYSFYATEDTKLQVTLQAAKKVDLLPSLRLLNANGSNVDLGDSKISKKPTKIQIKKFLMPSTGWYLFEVGINEGSGGYTLKTKGTPPKKFNEKSIAVETYEFDAQDGDQMTATVKKGKGSAADPVFVSLTDPDGEAFDFGEETNKIKKLPLTMNGTWTLGWRNDGGAGDYKIDVKLKIAKSKEKYEPGEQTSQAMGNIDAGDPIGAAAQGYVGSETCRTCHAEAFNDMVNSFHNSKMRNPFREGGGGYAIPPAVEAQFRAGTDLTQDPAYAGLNGLMLSYVEGDALPYKITIGTTTYEVMYVMGGNGVWKQRYVVKFGNSHYISPVQFNEKPQTYAAYHPEHWYDMDGNATPINPKNSWERRCGACHSTGLDVSYDAMSGEYTTGYAEMNIGCEACHGAGETHTQTQSADDILNPRDLIDGTAEGIQRADLVCGQCHGRGSGDKVDGSPDSTGYPWLDTTGIFPPGSIDLDSYYTRVGPSAFLQYKDNPMGFAPTPDDITDDTYLASRQHHQQWLDIIKGPHAPDKLYDGVCFDCHDPHGNGKKHMITDELTRSGHTFTDVSNDNNKLCLSCHATHGDFEDVTKEDVDLITDDSAPQVVVDAVVDHMSDKAAMPVDSADYDPAGSTAVGRCSKCHMVKTAKSAVYSTDAAGHNQGDIHGHTFLPIWPNVSVINANDITNSCNACHPLTEGDETQVIIEDWTSDPNENGTFHADTPRNFQNGVANHNRDGGVACAACHTTAGFVEIQVELNDIHALTGAEDADERNQFVFDSLQRDKGITCEACHGKQTDGTFAAGENPLRFPKAELCGRCHNNETVLYEDYVADGEIVRHPQINMLEGVDGGEVTGETYGNTAHTGAATDKCVTCHFNQDADGNHSFMPTIAACQVCHPTLDTFNRTARADYDGNGTVDGIQDEIAGCLENLQAAILGATTSTGAVITYDAPYFLIDGDRSNTAALDATADAALMRAIFNSYWVSFDASGGIHNTEYALQLLQNSYEEVTGTDWNTGTGGTKR